MLIELGFTLEEVNEFVKYVECTIDCDKSELERRFKDMNRPDSPSVMTADDFICKYTRFKKLQEICLGIYMSANGGVPK